MQARALELEAHVRNLDAARRRGEWAMARVALDRCLQVVEAEGSEIPTEWRLWRVEIELARGNWDGANSAAKYVSPCPFFFPFFCFGCTDVRGVIAMRCGCSPTRLMCSRSAASFSSFVAGFRRRYSMLNRHYDLILATSLHNACANA